LSVVLRHGLSLDILSFIFSTIRVRNRIISTPAIEPQPYWISFVCNKTVHFLSLSSFRKYQGSSKSSSTIRTFLLIIKLSILFVMSLIGKSACRRGSISSMSSSVIISLVLHCTFQFRHKNIFVSYFVDFLQ